MMLDVRRVARSMRRHALASLSVMAVYALCATAVAVVTTLLTGAEDARLPYPDAGRLFHVVWVPDGGRPCGTQGDPLNESVPYPVARALADSPSPLARLAVEGLPIEGAVRTGGRSDPLVIRGASGSLFSVLGVRPFLGAALGANDDRGDRPRVAVLSYGGWLRHFAADSSVMGRLIDVGSVRYTVVGVMPPAVEGDEPVDAWVRMDQVPSSVPSSDTGLSVRRVWIVGRLTPGATMGRFVAELRTRSSRLGVLAPSAGAGFRLCAVGMRSFMRPRGLTQIRSIATVTLFTLVIVSVLSISLLLLARYLGEQREFDIQRALGASFWRLARPAVLEALILGGLACIACVLLAMWAYNVLRVGRLFQNAWWMSGSVSLRALGAGVVLALAMALLPVVYAMTRALMVGRSGPEAQHSQFSRRPGSRSGARIVALQSGLSVVLLSVVATGALHVWRLRNVDVGFDAAHVVQVAPLMRAYGGGSLRWHAAADSQEGELRRIPGVLMAGAFQFGEAQSLEVRGGRAAVRSNGSPDLLPAYGDSTFFRTVSARLIRGRLPSHEEYLNNAPVAVVSARAARLLFGRNRLLGRPISISASGSRFVVTVVGAIADVNLAPRKGDLGKTIVWSPALLDPVRPPVILARGSLPAADLAAKITHTLQHESGTMAPRATPFGATMEARVQIEELPLHVVVPLAMITWMSAILGAVGMTLQTVGHRSRELGIRAAMGATPTRNYLFIARLVGTPIFAGLVGGVAVTALASGPFLQMLHLGQMPAWVPFAASLCFVGSALVVWVGPVSRVVRSAPAWLIRES